MMMIIISVWGRTRTETALSSYFHHWYTVAGPTSSPADNRYYLVHSTCDWSSEIPTSSDSVDDLVTIIYFPYSTYIS